MLSRAGGDRGPIATASAAAKGAALRRDAVRGFCTDLHRPRTMECNERGAKSCVRSNGWIILGRQDPSLRESGAITAF